MVTICTGSNGGLRVGEEEHQLPGYVAIAGPINERGANGKIFEVQDLLGQRHLLKIWIKKIGDSRDKKMQGFEEAKKLASLDHDNIISIKYFNYLDEMPYIIMPPINGIHIDEWLSNKPDLNHRYNAWSQIRNALIYCYSNNMFHGDLNFGNILISDFRDHVKIIDFGTSIFTSRRNGRKRDTKSLLKLRDVILCDNERLEASALMSELCDPHTILELIECNYLILFALKEINDGLSLGDNYAIKGGILSICSNLFERPLIDLGRLLDNLLPPHKKWKDLFLSDLGQWIEQYLSGKDNGWSFDHRRMKSRPEVVELYNKLTKKRLLN